MSSRITIMIDESNKNKLRNIQAKMIMNTDEGSVSFSMVLNLVLEHGLKKFKIPQK